VRLWTPIAKGVNRCVGTAASTTSTPPRRPDPPGMSDEMGPTRTDGQDRQDHGQGAGSEAGFGRVWCDGVDTRLNAPLPHHEPHR
jgi:hypothetical protein